jgi:hypothetical protein
VTVVPAGLEVKSRRDRVEQQFNEPLTDHSGLGNLPLLLAGDTQQVDENFVARIRGQPSALLGYGSLGPQADQPADHRHLPLAS